MNYESKRLKDLLPAGWILPKTPEPISSKTFVVREILKNWGIEPESNEQSIDDLSARDAMAS